MKILLLASSALLGLTVAIDGAASPTSQIFNPGVGRSAYAGLRYRF